MALQKQISFKGITFEGYCKVGKADFDLLNNNVIVDTNVYMNQECRQESLGNNITKEQNYIILDDEIKAKILDWLYVKLKEQDNFKEAIDA